MFSRGLLLSIPIMYSINGAGSVYVSRGLLIHTNNVGSWEQVRDMQRGIEWTLINSNLRGPALGVYVIRGLLLHNGSWELCSCKEICF